MAKKQNDETQMSIFDIELPPNNAEIAKEVVTKDTKEWQEALKEVNKAIAEEKKRRERILNVKNVPTVGSMLKKLDKAVYKIGAHEFLSDLFECGAIAISNKFDMRRAAKREERYLQIINKYDKSTQLLITELFSDIYVLLTSQLDGTVMFNDYLGELYMKSETSNKHSGQFFTPYNVSRLCAAVSVDREKAMQCMENNEVLTLSEPSCGSSGMIIAVADILYNQCDFNISHNLFVECSDIDSRCVHMSYLQLAFTGIPAVIYRRNTLSMETWERWETPALIMQWMRFKKYADR